MMGLNLNGTDIAIETRDERRETKKAACSTRRTGHRNWPNCYLISR